VILHFFLIRPTFMALKSLEMNVPVTVLVTDLFTAHPLWFLNRQPEFVVCSEILRQHCIALGIPDEQIQVFPPITDVRFSERIPDDRIPEVKAGLGFPADRPIVLLLGGADGLPRGARILRRIVESTLPVHVAIVCGRNRRLEEKARAIAAASQLPVTVFGYTDRVYELINVADVVISKGGASTIMEILLSGKMPVVSDYLWEQEKGNVEYLIEHGVGLYEHDAKEIPRILNRFFRDREWREDVARRISNLRVQNGVSMIAEHVHHHEQGA
jgi:processive 1,2-diacylglycerol beta-glucosyltransferase/1,2-diacylglycerol 3-beta-galactosyltransferase